MEEQIKTLMAEAHKFWRQGQEQEMLLPLKQALAVARQKGDVAKEIEILNEYGGALRVTGDHVQAVRVLTEALHLIAVHYSKNSEAYATTLMNLANTLRMHGALQEAESIFLKAKSLYEDLGLLGYPYASLCNNLSLNYQSMGAYEKAHQLLLDAVRLMVAEERLQVPLAITYNNLFEVCQQLHQGAQGEAYLAQARQLLEEAVGCQHPLYAAVLNNQASLAFTRGALAESLALYENSLAIVETAYGKDSRDCRAVAANVAKVKACLQETNAESESTPVTAVTATGSGCGLQLAQTFFEGQVLPTFKKLFPKLLPQAAFGLVGSGSECFGYDDEYSQDHDFTTRCCLWLPQAQYQLYREQLEEALQLSGGEVQLDSIENFYRNFTLCSGAPKTLAEWQRIPQDFLSVATNGIVFLDNEGTFSEIRRQLLAYYPRDLCLKKLAYCCNKMAQSGQYNYPRCLKRGNLLGAQAALAEFIKYYSEAVHLLNKKYLPFYKWHERSLKDCKLLGPQSVVALNAVLAAFGQDTSQAQIEALCCQLVEHFNAAGLTTSNVSFLTYQGAELAEKIADVSLRAENTWVL